MNQSQSVHQPTSQHTSSQAHQPQTATQAALPSAATGTTRPLRIVVGIAGGIAAYKACELIRRFKEDGHRVRAVPTPAALNFIGAATLEALTSEPVSTTVFNNVASVEHVHIGQDADLVVVAPATADLLSRMATGRADDLLTATLLMATCPVVVAPAMHTEMWLHPATQANVATLRERGVQVMQPAHGRLTGADSGPGRLPDPSQIQEYAYAMAAGAQLPFDLSGLQVVISAGGTRERLDPVRFLGNDSSGLQGYALAQVAAQRGASVTLVAANTASLSTPNGVSVVHVESARELAAQMDVLVDAADLVIMAAAVADFRPTHQADAKLKKEQGVAQEVAHLELTENPDILASLAGRASLVVGFAAETGDAHTTPVEFARRKLQKKGCDVLICNDVSGDQVFSQPSNAVTVLFADGREVAFAQAPKFEIAARIFGALYPTEHPAEFAAE